MRSKSQQTIKSRLGTISFAPLDYFYSSTSLFQFPRYYNEVKKQRTGSEQGGFITRETRFLFITLRDLAAVVVVAAALVARFGLELMCAKVNAWPTCFFARCAPAATFLPRVFIFIRVTVRASLPAAFRMFSAGAFDGRRSKIDLGPRPVK